MRISDWSSDVCSSDLFKRQQIEARDQVLCTFHQGAKRDGLALADHTTGLECRIAGGERGRLTKAKAEPEDIADDRNVEQPRRPELPAAQAVPAERATFGQWPPIRPRPQNDRPTHLPHRHRSCR